jgi:hypothetical protein
MRLCLPGESGGGVSRYKSLSEHEDYDWAIVPFEEYMHGFGSPDFAPIIGTPKLQSAIEQHNFGPLFSGALTSTRIGELPDGQWKAALATRFDRNISISFPLRPRQPTMPSSLPHSIPHPTNLGSISSIAIARTMPRASSNSSCLRSTRSEIGPAG